MLSQAGPVREVMARALRRELPLRYGTGTGEPFRSAVLGALVPGMSVLDAGAGREPVVRPADRPEGTQYWGLDISRRELTLAPEGSYGAVTVADLADRQEDLVGRFDLVTCFQVLEHVPDLPAVLSNLRAYLKPGGLLLAQLSGAWSVFAVASRLIPARLHRSAMTMVRRGGSGHEMFPTHYHRCWNDALSDILAGWSSHEVTPLYCGGWYLYFVPPLLSAYLAYEEWTLRGGHKNLASYYLISARA